MLAHMTANDLEHSLKPSTTEYTELMM